MMEKKLANLALQGGGAHGAFKWGVLERLLQEPRFEIDGVSATSAGAINAVVLAHGLTVGGREGAMNALAGSGTECRDLPNPALCNPRGTTG
jgi:NTE family protein